MKKEIIALLLAGGVGSRLNILVRKRAKPAIPFGGIYRIIDFTMSNIANSNIDVVGVLTQYKPLSLMEHIDNGRPWDLFGRTRLVEILPPKTGEESSDWYKGTSDAVYQNFGFVEDFSPDLVLIVSGDHIYHMNYNILLNFHKEKQAEATICLIRVPKEQAHHFGIAVIDENNRIIDWEEKPLKPKANLVSMGVYLFNEKVLSQTLIGSAKKSGADFAKDVIPIMLKNNRVFGFEFDGYWRDVGTLEAYWDTNMDILRPGSGLNIEDWQIKTNLSVRGEIGDGPSTYFGRRAKVTNSLVARGSVIEGIVRNSIISPGVRIYKNTVVNDSIIYHDVVIGADTVIKKSIVDKIVAIGETVQVGEGESIPNHEFPTHLYTGITVIGKGAKIPAGTKIGKNCIINPGQDLAQTDFKNISSGTTI